MKNPTKQQIENTKKHPDTPKLNYIRGNSKPIKVTINQFMVLPIINLYFKIF